MRQSGVLAAAALYALRHNRARVAEDHEAARRIAAILARSPSVRLDPGRVETNIVVVALSAPRAAQAVRAAEERGVLCHAIAPNALRLVTHLDFPAEHAEVAASRVADAIEHVHADARREELG